MQPAEIPAIAAIVAGAATGWIIATKRRRSAWRIAAAIAAYVFVAIAGGLSAAFFAVAEPGTHSRAFALARGISETMNCGAYGAIAGFAVGATVFATRRLRHRPGRPGSEGG
jgi:Ni/Fe-hydrogenase subunit HybB-like protein